MVVTTSFSGAVEYELCHLHNRDNYLERPQRIVSEAVIMHKWTHKRSNQDNVLSAPSDADTLRKCFEKQSEIHRKFVYAFGGYPDPVCDFQ